MNFLQSHKMNYNYNYSRGPEKKSLWRFLCRRLISSNLSFAPTHGRPIKKTCEHRNRRIRRKTSIWKFVFIWQNWEMWMWQVDVNGKKLKNKTETVGKWRFLSPCTPPLGRWLQLTRRVQRERNPSHGTNSARVKVAPSEQSLLKKGNVIGLSLQMTSFWGVERGHK